MRAVSLRAQDNAERAVRDMLASFSLAHGLPEVGVVDAEDQMDDGTPIRLRVTIDRRSGSATFDFDGGRSDGAPGCCAIVAHRLDDCSLIPSLVAHRPDPLTIVPSF
jgi:N-methylhydantoinase B/oxoprolinase/acetone carboxylase alpha subunit